MDKSTTHQSQSGQITTFVSTETYEEAASLGNKWVRLVFLEGQIMWTVQAVRGDTITLFSGRARRYMTLEQIAEKGGRWMRIEMVEK